MTIFPLLIILIGSSALLHFVFPDSVWPDYYTLSLAILTFVLFVLSGKSEKTMTFLSKLSFLSGIIFVILIILYPFGLFEWGLPRVVSLPFCIIFLNQGLKEILHSENKPWGIFHLVMSVTFGAIFAGAM